MGLSHSIMQINNECGHWLGFCLNADGARAPACDP